MSNTKQQQITANECTLCPTLWQTGQHVILLEPCHHTLHVGCMDKWMTNLPTDAKCNVIPCPICDGPVESQRHFRLAEEAPSPIPRKCK